VSGDYLEIVVAIVLVPVLGALAFFVRMIHGTLQPAVTKKTLSPQATQAQPPLAQQPQEPTSGRQSWIRSGIWFPFFVLSVVANVAQLWDFSPSAPEISPAPPTLGYQFQVPFFMDNTSVAFDIKNLVVTCALDRVIGNNGTFISNSAATSNAPNLLGAKHHGFYTCPFNVFLKPGEPIAEARIHFRLDYDRPWPLLGRVESHSEYYNWDPSAVPPQWIQGERIF
jgi:hypothetical protein